MRNLLALAAFAVLVFAVVGWFLDWYTIASNQTADGKRSININLNSKKISEDLNRGQETVRQVLSSDETDQQNKDRRTEENSQPSPPPTTPPDVGTRRTEPDSFWSGADEDDDNWFILPEFNPNRRTDPKQ